MVLEQRDIHIENNNNNNLDTQILLSSQQNGS